MVEYLPYEQHRRDLQQFKTYKAYLLRPSVSDNFSELEVMLEHNKTYCGSREKWHNLQQYYELQAMAEKSPELKCKKKVYVLVYLR